LAAAPTERRRLLILGGTGEAAALAERLAGDPRLSIVTSLAGRTRNPARLAGDVRVGGFGGAAGLAGYLQREAVALVVDATHPFAARMAANAAAACTAAGVPRLKLLRAAWRPVAGDRWIDVPDMAAAARAVGDAGRRVFLSVGRQDLGAFAGLAEAWFLVRSIDPLETPRPLARAEVIAGRGPFAEADEAALMREHRIDLLVSKNSGGEATYAKIAAARRLGLPVVMIARPPAPPGDRAASVDDAAAWVETKV
jgi:precorrin-6A/cobalt-precorrin-6A reductase